MLSLQGGFKMIGFISGGGKVLQYKWLFVFKSFFSRLLFWLYAWWLYVRFSPKKRRCCLFKEALKWAVVFLEVVRFYNINEFLFTNVFPQGFCFGSMRGDFMRDFHLKNKGAISSRRLQNEQLHFLRWGSICFVFSLQLKTLQEYTLLV